MAVYVELKCGLTSSVTLPVSSLPHSRWWQTLRSTNSRQDKGVEAILRKILFTGDCALAAHSQEDIQCTTDNFAFATV